MATLLHAISAAANILSADTDLAYGSLPAPFTIESEAVLVTSFEEGSLDYSIVRGQNGTAAASHAAGTAITANWAAGGGTTPGLDAVLAASAGQDIADGLTAADSPSASNPFSTEAASGVRLVRTLTPAEIAVLFSAGLELVPVVAGLGYIPRRASLVYRPADGAISGDPHDLLIGWQGLFGGVLTFLEEAFWDQPDDQFAVFGLQAESFHGDLGDFVGQPLTLWRTTADLAVVGPIAANNLAAGGADYVEGDVGSIDAGEGDAEYEIDSVDEFGAVVEYHLTAVGTGYAVANGVAGFPVSGMGSGFTVDITAIGGVSADLVAVYDVVVA